MTRTLTPAENIARLLEALEPLARIGDAYVNSELDEHRPEWNEKWRRHKFPSEVELFSGRGGKQLLTLADALKARELRDELKVR